MQVGDDEGMINYQWLNGAWNFLHTMYLGIILGSVMVDGIWLTSVMVDGKYKYLTMSALQ